MVAERPEIVGARWARRLGRCGSCFASTPPRSTSISPSRGSRRSWPSCLGAYAPPGGPAAAGPRERRAGADAEPAPVARGGALRAEAALRPPCRARCPRRARPAGRLLEEARVIGYGGCGSTPCRAWRRRWPCTGSAGFQPIEPYVHNPVHGRDVPRADALEAGPAASRRFRGANRVERAHSAGCQKHARGGDPKRSQNRRSEFTVAGHLRVARGRRSFAGRPAVGRAAPPWFALGPANAVACPAHPS